MRDIFYFLSSVSATNYSLRDFVPGKEQNLNSLPLLKGCKDVQAAQYCAIDCDDQFHACVADCNLDPTCVIKCSAVAETCTERCPCYSGCPNGCPCPYESHYCVTCQADFHADFLNCDHKLVEQHHSCITGCTAFDNICREQCYNVYMSAIRECPCMENCERGCPCKNYKCEYADDVYLLVFGPHHKPPLGPQLDPLTPQIKNKLYKKLTWYLGRNQFDGTTAVNGIKTPTGFDKDRRQMCSFTLKDEMFLIGGGNNMYLKVHEDRIEELDQLSFSFIDGRCAPVGDQFVMACAGDRTERACYKFEANGAYSKATSTREVHSAGAMSVFASRSDTDTAVIVAGRNNQQGSMEVFNERTGLWNVESTSVFMQYRAHFSIVRSRDQLMAFGGCIAEGGVCSRESTDVYYMKQSTMLWARFPQSLKSPRSNHVTLVNGDLILHIGGSSDKARKFESWRNSKADPGQYDIDESKTTLKNWSSYPYAFFVNYNTYNK